MSELQAQSLETCVGWMRAAGEPTRLRLLSLLNQADLTVTDLVDILQQSQPRISRHLKLLVEAGLAERFQEGAWAYFRVSDRGAARHYLDTVFKALSPQDAQLVKDNEALTQIRAGRAEKAARYFSANAEQWNRIRSLHVAERDVEAAMLDLGLLGKPGSLLDLGTGTGRILELFAPHLERGVGVDTSSDMLSLARTNLAGDQFKHLQVRQGDVYDLDMEGPFDLIILHQVLHFLERPAAAIASAASLLSAKGRLLIVDFAPHSVDFLREEHAHRWLGMSTAQVSRWLADADLAMENVRELESPENTADEEEALTVMLWLAAR